MTSDCGASEQSRENSENNGISLIEITSARYITIGLVDSKSTYRAEDKILPEYKIRVVDVNGVGSNAIKLSLSLVGVGTFEDNTKTRTVVTDSNGEARVKIKSDLPGYTSISATPISLGQFLEKAGKVDGKDSPGAAAGIYYVADSMSFTISQAAELKAKQEAEAKAAAEKAAAELQAKREAELKAELERLIKMAAEAKAEAERLERQAIEAAAKAAAELKAKQEAEAKAAAELKAKQEAEAERQLLESSNEATDAANAATDAANTAALATDASIMAALDSIDELSAQVDLLVSEIREQVSKTTKIFNRVKSKVKK
jgi:chemotaxis protein histidine kinase CheA